MDSDMGKLDNRVAIVTAAASGMGLGAATRLAEEGAHVYLTDIDAAAANEAAKSIQESGGNVTSYQLDVTDLDGWKALLKEIEGTFGTLHVLHHHAGIPGPSGMEVTSEEFDFVVDVNLKAALYWCRAAARPLSKARGGSIVNVSSIVGITGNAGQSNYAAAKAGLFGLTRSLAKELGSRNVRVNAVAPGYIQTDMTSGLPAEVREASLKRVPLGRLGEGADIARAVRFLVSEEAAYITGVTLVVDGGFSL